MRKRIMGLGLAVLMLTGCSAESAGSSEDSPYRIVEKDIMCSPYSADCYPICVTTMVDSDTGVNYIITADKDGKLQVTPRYNADGSLVVSEVEVK